MLFISSGEIHALAHHQQEHRREWIWNPPNRSYILDTQSSRAAPRRPHFLATTEYGWVQATSDSNGRSLPESIRASAREAEACLPLYSWVQCHLDFGYGHVLQCGLASLRRREFSRRTDLF